MNKLTNTQHWLTEQAERYSTKIFITEKEKQITFNTLLDNSFSHASKLIEIGISENDKVGILSENNPDFIELIFSLWFIGAVSVPMNIRNKAVEIEELAHSIDIKFILVHSSLKNDFSFFNNITINNFPFKLESDSSINYQKEFHQNNNALILFTSGSTHKPKAVLHTFSNLYESALLTNEILELTENDKWLASLPFYHIGGFMIIIRALLSASSIILADSLSVEGICSAMNKYNPTHISLVSTVLKQLLELKVKPNTNLKQLYLGGGPLTEKLCTKSISIGFPIVKVYGSTETCSMVTALSTTQFNSKPNSVGKPLGDTEIKILDEYGNTLSKNQTGEIVIKGKTIFKEYVNNFDQTKKVFRKKLFLTGDYGFIDDEGFLFIDFRREDLIISGGENINPKEVEISLLNYPNVKDAYVFAEEEVTWGQIVCAAIVSNIKIEESILIDYLKSKIASYKVPKKFYFVSNIPRNEMGKVQREKLIEKLISNID